MELSPWNMLIKRSMNIIVLISLLSSLKCLQCQTLRKLGQIHAPHAAFATVVENESVLLSLDRYRLLITGFNPVPLLPDFVYQVNAVGRHLSDFAHGTASAAELSRDVTWPNEALKVPDNVFNKTSFIVVAGGFLVPTKDHGSLTLFDLSVAPPTKHVLTSNTEDSKWFYHRAEWRDMNGDGLVDLVTCRARVHVLGGKEGQLVWFQHPLTNALSQTWVSHVIAADPDVYFTLTSLPSPNGAIDAILTAGFFSQSLNVYWTTHPQKRWDDPTKVSITRLIQHRVIDNTIGQVFDVAVVDLNKDGTLDLLVTNNAVTNASLFAYTLPADFRTDHFPRRTLLTGISSRKPGQQGTGAPGSALAVYPQPASHSGKPWIIVSGDDDGQAHLLKPLSTDASDWSYEHTVFLDVGRRTIGGIGSGDVDGDGYTEVFVPSYDEGLMYAFTFKP